MPELSNVFYVKSVFIFRTRFLRVSKKQKNREREKKQGKRNEKKCTPTKKRCNETLVDHRPFDGVFIRTIPVNIYNGPYPSK